MNIPYISTFMSSIIMNLYNTNWYFVIYKTYYSRYQNYSIKHSSFPRELFWKTSMIETKP